MGVNAATRALLSMTAEQRQEVIAGLKDSGVDIVKILELLKPVEDDGLGD